MLNEINSIEDVPLLRTTLRITKFLSLLRRHDWRRYVVLVPYFTINIMQFLDIYYSDESIDAVIRKAYIALLFFNTILRGVMFCVHRFKYEKIMEDLKSLYIELLVSRDPQVTEMLEATAKDSDAFGKINLLIGSASVISFLVYPLFATSKVLPYGMYFPLVDKHESPYYELFFVIQTIMAPMGCCMYIPFTNMVVSFMMFVILMCKVLQSKLRQLNELPRDQVANELVSCIRYQLKAVRLVDAVNKLTTYIFLVEFLASGAMICAMLFIFIIVQTIGQKICVCAYILMIFSQCAVMYYYANEMYDQSMAVAVAAYDSNWFNFDVSTQKSLKLFILRAQQPCAILIGNVYPMNLQMLQSLLNATYSYFTLLKRVYG